MTRYTNVIFFGLVLWLAIASVSLAQSRTALPAATTVPVVGERSVGTLVRYDDSANRYEPTVGADDPFVYGVVAERPAVVFVTSSTSVPVVTSGTALVKIDGGIETLQVGDILTSAPSPGYARLASTTDDYAFGFVNETSDDFTNKLVSVVVDPERARHKLTELRHSGLANQAEDTNGWTVSAGRAIVAAIVVIVGLGAVVFGTRVTLSKAITAVGRNPRARGTVFGMAGITILSAFALGVLTILVGVGILILPL